MRDSGTDQRTATNELTDGELPSPAALAQRVVTLTGDELGIRGGSLPLWDRLSGRSSRGWSRASGVVAWCVTLGTLAAALLRIGWHDATVPLMWLNAFTFYLYLPAYLALAFAAWTGRWWLATASAAVVACHLVWVGPDFRPATPFIPPPATASEQPQSLRIFYANVHGSNRDLDGVLDEALQADPDIIVFTELQRWWFQQLEKCEALAAAYPYGTNVKRRHAGDVNVFSRLRIGRQQFIDSQGRTCLAFDVLLGKETLRLFCLHSPRPIPDGTRDYELFWQKMEPIVAEQPEPLVVIGDFNATQHSLVYQRLIAGRLRSAHEDRGRGYATTWPHGRRLLPPIRIDQALLSPAVECVSIVEGVGPGSDHKPLILDLRIYPSPTASEPSPGGDQRRERDRRQRLSPHLGAMVSRVPRTP